MLSADGFRDADRTILDYLRDGRVTPAYARARLRGESEEYSRGYIQQRLVRLEEHDHVQTLYGTGLYDLVDDPLEDGDRDG